MTSSLRRWIPWALTAVFAVVAATVVWIRIPPGACTVPTEVHMVASTEKARLLEGLADTYNGLPARTGTCAHVTVEPRPSGEEARALAANEAPPDLWSPASSAWARYVNATRSDPIPDEGDSLAQTPMVIAMPEPMARALGWPQRRLGWSDLAAMEGRDWATIPGGRPEWGRFTLGKTNPTVSTSGLYALLAALADAPGRAGAGLYPGKIDEPQVLYQLKRIEAGVVHYGQSELEFLDSLYAESPNDLTYVSAVAVEEKSVLDYNQGNPSGDPGERGALPEPAVHLVTFIPPDGTFYSDSPCLTVNPDTADAAQDFCDWLRDTQQPAFQAAGFRDVHRVAGPSLTAAPRYEFAADAPPELALPAADDYGTVIREAVDGWSSRVRKSADVLLAVDSSTSMSWSTEGPGRPGEARYLAVDAAATAALTRFASTDTMGMWRFRSPFGGGPLWRVVADQRPYQETRPAIAQSLRSEPDGGDTPIYRTTRDAVAALRRDYDPLRTNAVILLTDGQETQEPTPESVEETRRVIAEDPSRPVRVFYIAYTADTGGDTRSAQASEQQFDALKQIARASGGYVYDARDPARLGDVFTRVISNF